MARRTIVSTPIIENLSTADGRHWWESQDPHSYICYLCDDPGVTGLMWREVKKMIRWALRPARGADRLTDQQLLVLEGYLLGASDAEIAERMGVTRQAIRKSRLEALRKIALYRPAERGMLTVMIEEFGWPAVREHLTDLFEEWLQGEGCQGC